ncbi:MAG: PilZ domain-containing protein [Nitrospirota bacterium]|jgi:hypothetical protein
MTPRDRGVRSRRKHPRYPLYAVAELRFKYAPERGPVETIVAIANISTSGLGLYSHTPLENGSHVTLDITLSGRKDMKERLEGRIVWVSKEENLHLIGVAFEKELNEREHPLLYRLVSS